MVEEFALEVIIIDMKAETDKRMCTEIRERSWKLSSRWTGVLSKWVFKFHFKQL